MVLANYKLERINIKVSGSLSVPGLSSTPWGYPKSWISLRNVSWRALIILDPYWIQLGRVSSSRLCNVKLKQLSS